VENQTVKYSCTLWAHGRGGSLKFTSITARVLRRQYFSKSAACVKDYERSEYTVEPKRQTILVKLHLNTNEQSFHVKGMMGQ
jgi:hypothetical protein